MLLLFMLRPLIECNCHAVARDQQSAARWLGTSWPPTNCIHSGTLKLQLCKNLEGPKFALYMTRGRGCAERPLAFCTMKHRRMSRHLKDYCLRRGCRSYDEDSKSM
jgi:hypothetical protein